MHKMEFTDQDIVHLIIALQRYEAALLENEEDAGPSFGDSLRVENLLKRLRAARSDAGGADAVANRVADN